MIRPFWKLLHVAVRDDAADGDRVTTMCGKRRRIHTGPELPPLPLLACTSCTDQMVRYSAETTAALNDALGRLVDISAAMNRPGAARSDGAA